MSPHLVISRCYRGGVYRKENAIETTRYYNPAGMARAISIAFFGYLNRTGTNFSG
jgi:hypothetical protein